MTGIKISIMILSMIMRIMMTPSIATFSSTILSTMTLFITPLSIMIDLKNRYLIIGSWPHYLFIQHA